MAFEKICTVDDVWEGDMDAFETKNGTQVLVLGVDCLLYTSDAADE